MAGFQVSINGRFWVSTEERVGALPTFHSDRCADECAALREQSYAWALQIADAIATVYESDELDRRVRRLALTDLAADIWKPLFAVATAVGLDDATVGALERLAVEMNGDPAAATGDLRRLAIVRILRKHVRHDKCRLTSSDVVDLLISEGVTATEREVSSLRDEWQIAFTRLSSGRYWVLTPSILAGVEERLQKAMLPMQESSHTPLANSSNTDHRSKTHGEA